MLRFEVATQRYRDTDTGRFVGRGEILKLVDEEVNRLEVRLKAHGRLLQSQKIDIAEFQTRMTQSLKESHLRMAALGGGGFKQMTPKHYGHVGQQLKRQYEFLHGFGQDLQNKNLTSKQIINRAGSYAKSANIAFYQAEFLSKGKVGFYAKRLLDPQSHHCVECISYQKKQWTLLQKIIPPGINCSCGGRCRCQIIFRKV